MCCFELGATCDTKKERKEKCAKIIPKFLPLMSVSPTTFRTTGETFLNVTNTDENKERNSTLVCSKYGAAGIGVLSDHGTKKIHGMFTISTAFKWKFIFYCIFKQDGPLGKAYLFEMNGFVRILTQQRFSDYDIVHNGGRGALMYDFRNFMMENIGLNARSTGMVVLYDLIFRIYASYSRIF